MALPTVTIDYSVVAKSVAPAVIQAALEAVPIPFDELTVLGAYVETDLTTISGTTVKRELVLSTVPTSNATATANLVPGQSGSPIASFTVTGAGAGYLTPPVALIEDPAGSLASFLGSAGKGGRGQAYLTIVAAPQVTSPGSGYSASTKVAFVGGLPLGMQSQETDLVTGSLGALTTRNKDAPFANGTVVSVSIQARGRLYPTTTVILVTGDPAVTRQATFLPVLDAKGRLVSVIVTDGGAGYKKTPTLVLFDPTGVGEGAILTANMARGTPATGTVTRSGGGGITGVVVVTPGDGYVSPPTVVITDPTGVGSGAAATAGPVIGGAASGMGVGRIDVLAGGAGYVAPVVTLEPVFTAEFLGAAAAGDVTSPLRAFASLMKSAIQSRLATQVTEAIS